MTIRDLVKNLETCDLDKQIVIVVSMVSEKDDTVDLLLREVRGIIENKDFVGIQ